MKFRNIFYNFNNHTLPRQFIGFLYAAIVSNIVNFVSYLLLFKYLFSSIAASAIIGQFLGLLTNYLINSRLVFKKRLNKINKTLYFIYYIGAILFVGKSIEIIAKFGIDYRVSWLICVFFISICNFTFLKFFAFKR